MPTLEIITGDNTLNMEGRFTRRDSFINRSIGDNTKTRNGEIESGDRKDDIGIYNKEIVFSSPGEVKTCEDGEIKTDDDGIYEVNMVLSIFGEDKIDEHGDDGLETTEEQQQPVDVEREDARVLQRTESLANGVSASVGNNQDLVRRAEHERGPDTMQIAENIVTNAITQFEDLQARVNSANAMLVKMRKNGDVIPAELMADVQATMVTGTRSLYVALRNRNENMDQLRDDVDFLEEKIRRLMTELSYSQNLVNTLTAEVQEAKQSGGSSLVEQANLKMMGFKSVQDLLSHYFDLQDQLKVQQGGTCRSEIPSNRPEISTRTEACHLKNTNQSNQQPFQELHQPNQSKPKNQGESFGGIVSGGNAPVRVHLPMPEKFTGSTRIELERFFWFYEEASTSRGWSDKERALYLGSYIPKMQTYHDSMYKRNVSYADMKVELLNSFGSNSSVAMYTLRGELDRVKKPVDKLYKDLFDDLEKKVTQAFGDDPASRETELKKILMRITEEDPDPVYRTIVLTSCGEGYYRLKELVLGVESARVLNKKDKQQPVAPSRRGYTREQQHQSYEHPEERENGRYSRRREADDSNFQQRESMNRRVEGDSRYPYTGTCYNCKKPGHNAKFCTEPKEHGVLQIKKLEDMELAISGIAPVG